MLSFSKFGRGGSTKYLLGGKFSNKALQHVDHPFRLGMSKTFQSTAQLQSHTGLATRQVEDNCPSATGKAKDNLPDAFVQNIQNTLSVDKTTARGLQECLFEQRNSIATRIYHVAEGQSFLHSPGLFKNTPAYFHTSKLDKVPYWQVITRWKDVSEALWLDHNWATSKNIQGKQKLYQFLNEVLSQQIKPQEQKFKQIQTREDFIKDVMEGIESAPMSIRLSPHLLSRIDWSHALEDPIRRQFIPMKSALEPDHPMLTLDSLHEAADSPIEGLVHRYTDKCLFLATSVCGHYCRYCTRSYAVGANTETVTKASLKPKKARWEEMFEYIENTPAIQDVVISGGDSYLLAPHQVRLIGRRLLKVPHVRRIRYASKGLCVSPGRTLDPNDDWTNALIEIVDLGRTLGKHVALHTHFNHINEFSWVTREAAQKLFAAGVTVRNQSVLLRGVNDTKESMGALIRELADNNIIPYYVYQHDLVSGLEDLRTPLSTILNLERELRGSIAGFMMPQFVVDLPGGGGKRLAASYENYDREIGRSTFTAPAVKGGDAIYEYWDPMTSLSPLGRKKVEELGKVAVSNAS